MGVTVLVFIYNAQKNFVMIMVIIQEWEMEQLSHQFGNDNLRMPCFLLRTFLCLH